MTSSKTHRITTPKHTRTLGSLVAAGALLAIPAVGQARNGHAHPAKPAKANACAAHNVPFNVSGTFVSATADNPMTAENEGTVTLTVTNANRHARNSGEIADQNAARKGVQVRGATYTVATTDAYVLKLNGYEGTDTVSVGDKVNVRGKVALTKRHCAAAGTSVADRYGAVDVRKVTISDRDADA